MNDTQTALIQLLRENGKMSRNQLSEMLGISLMGVSKALSGMARNHLIVLRKNPNGGPGRPSETVEVGAEGGYSLGINVNHFGVEATLVDLRNKVVFFGQIPFSFRALSLPPVVGDMAPVFALIGKALAAVPRKKLVAVGLGVSGDFDFTTGQVLKAYDFISPGQADAFRRFLSEETGLPVSLVHDTESGLIAERWSNPDLPPRPTLLSISDRLGMSLMFDGRLFRGSPSWRRWLGHAPVPSSSEPVPNYLPGPLAATALSTAWTDLLQGIKYGHRPPVVPDVWRREMDEFYALFEQNDPRCRKIVEQGMKDLAVVVRNLCILIPFDGIIVHGWIPEILEMAIDAIRQSLREGSEAHGHTLVEMKPPVYAATLRERTEGAGAALFAMDELFSSKMITRGWKRETAKPKPKRKPIKQAGRKPQAGSKGVAKRR
ncbi:Sugar kinase of the NBD/HSP70 family, may contain an N-terminal HTH domain [Verrucomicrobium sp. GAS474]|uniref:ROK family transcriptional regulator n=1 Tax=Verrucomicrobium sp. GAS474 TaxID=1882831 RepID=UPI00087B5D47|nr:ROK family transcriptional regulator [Verrucomicrobium sp. GAS474]SDT92860.1 Sugar kinase of the NBD/HSP70 family, may contain an N-terminal HTH domain [Verrucomicrobium sp. GAS474]